MSSCAGTSGSRLSPWRGRVQAQRSIYLRGCSAMFVTSVRVVLLLVVGFALAAVVFMLAAS
jgi:hypothetical protein